MPLITNEVSIDVYRADSGEWGWVLRGPKGETRGNGYATEDAAWEDAEARQFQAEESAEAEVAQLQAARALANTVAPPPPDSHRALNALVRELDRRTHPTADGGAWPATLILGLPAEFLELCKGRQVSPEVVLRSFIADLCDLRTKDYCTNGADERDHADTWFRRASVNWGEG
jgi:hypothetical protein